MNRTLAILFTLIFLAPALASGEGPVLVQLQKLVRMINLMHC